jgi:hypothetical protein
VASHFLIGCIGLLSTFFQEWKLKNLILFDWRKMVVGNMRDKSQKNGVDRSKLNQVANYEKMQLEINIKLSNQPPKEYFEFITT